MERRERSCARVSGDGMASPTPSPTGNPCQAAAQHRECLGDVPGKTRCGHSARHCSITTRRGSPQVQQLDAQIAAVQREFKAEFMTVRTVAAALRPRKTHCFECRRVPAESGRSPARHAGSPGAVRCVRRAADALDLARWLVSPDNPLTPRVAANHVWSYLFGRGLVATANDFGPSAANGRVIRNCSIGWPPPTSATCGGAPSGLSKPSSCRPPTVRPRCTGRNWPTFDPLNTLLYRQNRLRVDGEIVRDLGALGQRPAVNQDRRTERLPADAGRLGQAESTRTISLGRKAPARTAIAAGCTRSSNGRSRIRR